MTAAPDVKEAGPVVRAGRLSRGWYRTLAAVVVVQGVYVFKHVVQLVQVFLLGVPEDDALGLLGYVLEFQGTEEWLHLGFNLVYLAGIWLLVLPLRRATPDVVPREAFGFFLLATVALQTWHGVEHTVIIAHVLANSGCPCPGILDTALGTTDTVLHFIYNAVTFAGLLVPYVIAARADRPGR